MTKKTSSNRSAFSQRQFNADTYADTLPLRVPLALNQTTLVFVKIHYVVKPICRR